MDIDLKDIEIKAYCSKCGRGLEITEDSKEPIKSNGTMKIDLKIDPCRCQKIII